MLTNNFYAVMARMAEGNDSNSPAVALYSSVPVTIRTGVRKYLCGLHNSTLSFPGTMSFAPTLSADGQGVIFGTGSTPPTLDDRKLESQITSGVTLALASRTGGRDQYGNPKMELVYSVRNNGSAAITISEIGWAGVAYVGDYPDLVGASVSLGAMLFDRTVLDDPITIAAGATGLIKYTISASIYQPRTVAGVEIVQFSYGTDEQIAAMIGAARAGTIDLQTDAGWQIGDVRAISVGAVDTQAANTLYVFISSFDEYEGCGNVMQLDFARNYLKSKMNSTGTNVGGYGSSYMCTTFLPLVEAALPSWLRSLLLPFNVKASAGNRSSEIVTVQNNKIALRSEVEMFGSVSQSFAGEGQLQEAYKRSAYRTHYVINNATRWLRSPFTGNNQRFVTLETSGNRSSVIANTEIYSFAAFMCV